MLEVSAKDTQTDVPPDNSGEKAEGSEKGDEDKSEKKEEVRHWSVERIKKEYRRFNIDLAPKVIIGFFLSSFFLALTNFFIHCMC